MRRVGAIVIAFVAVMLLGAGAASADSNAVASVGSFTVQTPGGTIADCDSTDVGHTDTPAPVTGMGPFSTSLATNPAAASASCADGSGTDTTSGSLNSSATIDQASGNLIVQQAGTGTTTANATYTGSGSSGSVDIGSGVSSNTSVEFTIAQPQPFTFTGAVTTTQPTHATYSLTETSQPVAVIFDQTHDGLSPTITGTLQPGTYRYLANVRVSNDICCNTSGTQTDSYDYHLNLHVGQEPGPGPSVSIVTKRAKVRHHKVNVTLACTGTGTCQGIFTLGIRRKGKTVALAPAKPYSVKAGSRKTLTLTLSAGALRRLRRARPHRLKADASATVTGGKTATQTITLRL